MRNHRLSLLSSAAFANPGAETMARIQHTPDASPLAAAVAMIPGTASVGGDIMEMRTPDIDAMVPYWDKTDAIIAGYDAVKSAGQDFLPRFKDEDDATYDNRLMLTKLTNIYADVVEGLAAKPFEEEISFAKKPSAEVEKLAEDIDGDGNNLTAFASQTFYNGINSAIDWIFIDYPKVDRAVVRTQADQKRMNIRPYWTHVLGRNVRQVKSKKVGGKIAITYIRVFEPGINEKDAVRIFELDDAGRVVWNLYRKSDKMNEQNKTQYVYEDGGVLSIDVIPAVPFITGRRDGAGWKFRPAMQSAVDLQINLYRNESALEFATTMTGYAMLTANGMRPEMMPDGKTPKKVRVGPSVVLWALPNGDGNYGEWKYLEHSAANLKFMAEKIETTKQDLRELGRQPLTATSGNLTVITTAVAAGKARSAVSAWALGLKDALENAWVITCKFMSTNEEPEINVYNEFDAFADGNSDLETLDKGRDRGDISRKTYWLELKRRKVLSPEFKAEDEEALLLKEMPGDADLEDDDDQVIPPVTKPAPQPGNAA